MKAWLLALSFLIHTGAASAEQTDPPFNREAYLAEYGGEAFKRLIRPIVSKSPVLKEVGPRFIFGTGEHAGAIIDRSLKPPRPLKESEVGLLIRLRRFQEGISGEKPLELAASVDRQPQLFGGIKAAKEVSDYLRARADGADDRVPPPGIFKIPGIPEKEPVAAESAPDPKQPQLTRAPPPESKTPKDPPLPENKTPESPPPPNVEEKEETGVSDLLEGWKKTFSEPLQKAVSAVKETAGNIQKLLENPTPEARLILLEAKIAVIEPYEILDALKEFKDPAIIELPKARETLLRIMASLPERFNGSDILGLSALDQIGQLIEGKGWLKADAVANYAEAAALLTQKTVTPNAGMVKSMWAPVVRATDLNEEQRAKVAASKSKVVQGLLDSLLESIKKEVTWQNYLSPFSFQEPPLKGAPELEAFAKKALAAAAKSPGDPYWRLALMGNAISMIEKNGTLDPETAISGMEAMAAVPLFGGELKHVDSLVGSISHPYRRIQRVIDSDKSPEGDKRKKRFEAAKKEIIKTHLPRVMAQLKSPDPKARIKAVENLGLDIFKGRADIRPALIKVLDEIATQAPTANYEEGPLLFAAVVSSIGNLDTHIADEERKKIAAATKSLKILTPPGSGATNKEWLTYLKGVETARNALRAATLDDEEKAKLLDEFDAAFAEAYDKGRAPMAPKDALAKLYEVGPKWIGEEFFKEKMAFSGPSANQYTAAIRETTALFIHQAGKSDFSFTLLDQAVRENRLLMLKENKAGGKDDRALFDLEFLQEVLSEERFREVEAAVKRIPVTQAPVSSAGIYLQAYRLTNLRALLKGLPKDAEDRKAVEEMIAKTETSLTSGIKRLSRLPDEIRASGPGGSRDQLHARMTGLLSLPPEKIPKSLKEPVRVWLETHGPLRATYNAFPSKLPRDGENLERGGAARNVMLGLFGYHIAESEEEKKKRLEGLEAALNNFARHEAILRASMHRFGESFPHLYENVGVSGSDGIAPYYYPSSISRVLESFDIALNDPAIQADEKRLKKLEKSYRIVREGLLKEFDAVTGLREPLRKNTPWLYTLLGTAVAELALNDT